jgi:stage V sporulation protein S
MAQDPEQDFIRVGAGANAEKIAGVISAAVQLKRAPSCRAVGASAVNQMVKACAIARGYVAPSGIDLHFIPGFANVPDRDDPTKEITCMTMRAVLA